MRFSGLLTLLLIALPSSCLRAQNEAREYEIKAALIYNFTRFIEWPGEGGGEFRICILGTDPFGADLDPLAARTVRERPIRLERPPAQVGNCQLVYVPDGTSLPAPAPGMLVVAEDAAALGRGAVIAVSLERGHVSFDINPDAAARAGLKVSYKLLRLARSAR